MKRILTLLSAFMLALSVNAYAADEVEIYIDDEKLECENAPVKLSFHSSRVEFSLSRLGRKVMVCST